MTSKIDRANAESLAVQGFLRADGFSEVRTFSKEKRCVPMQKEVQQTCSRCTKKNHHKMRQSQLVLDCRILTSPWGADNTQAILDVLADYGVPATFFVVGNWADQYPEQARAIVASGNELQNHSNAHDHYNSLTADEIIADVNACSDKIESLTGVRPTLIRCPFGEYDDHVISAIRSIGMEPIQWDVETLARASNPCRARLFRVLESADKCGKIDLLSMDARKTICCAVHC